MDMIGGLKMNNAFYMGAFETREVEGPGAIEGRAIVFDTATDLGLFDEVIDRHALDNADLRDVRLCLNHDTSFVYARSRNNNENSTMQLRITDEGMDIRANLDVENSPLAQSFKSAIDRRDIDKMSFMFVVSREEWTDIDSEHPTRIIREISRVLEVSAVTFPAYDTTFIKARSLADALDSARASLESAKAEAREVERKKQRIRILTEVK